MGSVIGEILPLAVGVAISPIPVIATILMLLSPKARTTSVGFLVGWVVGIALAVTVFTLLSAVIPAEEAGGSTPIVGTIQIALGALLLMVAVRQWGQRPKEGVEPTMPGWMKAIDTMNFVKAAGLALLLAAVNPKNLLLAVSAGLTIGSANLAGGQQTAAIIVFVLIGASTVLVPVIAYLLAADRLRGTLDAVRAWLTRENAVIMAVLLLVLGVNLIGKGIGSF